MKNKFKIISILLCAVVCVFALIACAPGAPEHDASAPNYVISESELQNEFDLFITGREDRTSFTAAEMNAALYLQSRLIEFGYNEVELQEFKTSEGDVNNLESQNVVARYASGAEAAKHVIIGAYYDNRYSHAYKGAAEYRSAGALANATGVATLLCIANYLMRNKPELGFDVTLVFFGGSFVTDAGARAYLRNDGFTKTDRDNTVLMVELQRLGVDHVYAFSDERKTQRETFFDRIAQENALDIYKPTQKSPIITGVSALEGVTYYRWAHNGMFSPFFESGIPTLNLVGANWETINFTDTESSVNANIAYTSEDNADTLKRLYPDYAQKMATAATLVIRSLEDEAFLPTLSADRDNFPDTSVLNKRWIWSLVVVGALLLGGVALFFAYAHINKKYPRSAPAAPPKMKMAVFGMDYEDKSASDIFIDIRRADGDDIFPGIPNNDDAHKTELDDIFPPLDDKSTSNDRNDTDDDK